MQIMSKSIVPISDTLFIEVSAKEITYHTRIGNSEPNCEFITGFQSFSR